MDTRLKRDLRGEKHMCEYCGRRFCPSGCPNAEYPEPKHECESCSEGIYAGENAICIDVGEESWVHSDCLKRLPEDELLELLKVSIEDSQLAPELIYGLSDLELLEQLDLREVEI